MKQLSLKANMLWNSFGSLFYSGCQWLVTVMVVRLSTSYEAAGILAVAMGCVERVRPDSALSYALVPGV